MRELAIFGAPRSGTSWLGQIFNSSPYVAYRFQPLFSYAFKGRLNEQSSADEIDRFNTELLATQDSFVLQNKTVTGREGLVFSKVGLTHLVWKEVRYHYVIENLMRNSGANVIGIVRHPCAVINSWLQAPKEFDSDWDPLEEWRWAPKKNMNKREEYNGFEKWKEIALLYLDLEGRYPDTFKLTTYEALNRDTEAVVRELFLFANLEFSECVADFIRLSKSRESDDPYGVFRAMKNNDDWIATLSRDIQKEILSDNVFQHVNRKLNGIFG